MDLRTAGLSAAAGTLAGVVGTLLLRPTPGPVESQTPAPAARSERRVVTAPPPSAPCAPTPQDPALSACQLETQFLRGQLELYEGVHQGWPDSVPAAYTQAELEPALQASWGELVEIDGMDCSEYPCLVFVSLSDDEHMCCAQLREVMPASLDGYEPRLFRANARGSMEEGMRAVVALGDSEHWHEALDLRTSWRVEVAAESLLESPAGDD